MPGHVIWCTAPGCARGRPCPSCTALLAEREAAEAAAGGIAGRVAWFHAPHPRSEVTERARTDTRAWRIYGWWRAGQHSPAAATPDEVRAAVAGVPELALTGRHAPRSAGQFADVLAGVAACEADWAAKAETTTADMIRGRRSRQWRAGYELRHLELAETLCYRPRGGGGVVHRGHCGECRQGDA
jgi:hypothetical protein